MLSPQLRVLRLRKKLEEISMRVFLIVALLVLGSASARADLSAGDLFDSCTSKETPSQIMCLWFVMGVREGMRWGSRESKTCVLDTEIATDGQTLKEIVVEYIRARPQHKDKPAGLLAMVALKEAYPCK
jgi:hypothetical protein